MTPQEEARERARLLIAWADGKTLQGFVGGTWEDWDSDESPGIAFPDQWRIKIVPRRIWTTRGSDGILHEISPENVDSWKAEGHIITEWQEVIK